VPRLIQAEGWDAQPLPRSRPPLRMRAQSSVGLSGASIDAFDEIRFEVCSGSSQRPRTTQPPVTARRSCLFNRLAQPAATVSPAKYSEAIAVVMHPLANASIELAARRYEERHDDTGEECQLSTVCAISARATHCRGWVTPMKTEHADLGAARHTNAGRTRRGLRAKPSDWTRLSTTAWSTAYAPIGLSRRRRTLATRHRTRPCWGETFDACEDREPNCARVWVWMAARGP
jgi:hypothetical protein